MGNELKLIEGEVYQIYLTSYAFSLGIIKVDAEYVGDGVMAVTDESVLKRADNVQEGVILVEKEQPRDRWHISMEDAIDRVEADRDALLNKLAKTYNDLLNTQVNEVDWTV